ncbi:MAG: Trm112 family protein [Thermodesulfobacterium sp.]|uniref:RNA methyltransferase activator Trm112/YbaR n=1 Tax=Candidatus Thermodesulfobacterium syntrophicum TaxID=3060442 RepID=A0AAE3P3Y1_9BACT|nr:Trm112 family protein [Thermodesulfobacterium sp.]MCD6548044.1 Trm112 family protein [Thermodesulfobacterium sp.]MDF2953195.1 RNA methyltransferase activator Trm112/YbaR [Candidatus Thermodesulfobacterium syntrophicum]HEA83826.1 Trm112 family protein [Thermodesulfobacterium geofontis]
MEKAKIQEYLKVLACPKCKGELIYKIYSKKEGFYCEKCKLFYPIVEDIPVMLIEEAINLPASEKNESP